MRLNMSFDTPYTRSQIRAGLVNLTLPATAVVSIGAIASITALGARPNSEQDLIHRLMVDGLETLGDVAAFLASLPPSVNARFAGIEIAPY